MHLARIAIPLAWGPNKLLPFLPHKVPVTMCVGAPIEVEVQESAEGGGEPTEPTQAQIDELHAKVCCVLCIDPAAFRSTPAAGGEVTGEGGGGGGGSVFRVGRGRAGGQSSSQQPAPQFVALQRLSNGSLTALSLSLVHMAAPLVAL
jgi:hypothetical protein